MLPFLRGSNDCIRICIQGFRKATVRLNEDTCKNGSEREREKRLCIIKLMRTVILKR